MSSAMPTITRRVTTSLLRNRLTMQSCLDLVYVRTSWLRRELEIVTDEELECFKEWETQLLRRAKQYRGPVEPDAGREKQKRIFEDRFDCIVSRLRFLVSTLSTSFHVLSAGPDPIRRGVILMARRCNSGTS